MSITKWSSARPTRDPGLFTAGCELHPGESQEGALTWTAPATTALSCGKQVHDKVLAVLVLGRLPRDLRSFSEDKIGVVWRKEGSRCLQYVCEKCLSAYGLCVLFFSLFLLKNWKKLKCPCNKVTPACHHCLQHLPEEEIKWSQKQVPTLEW